MHCQQNIEKKFTHKLLSITTKLRLQNAVIKPVVSYASEKSIMKKQIEETLLISEIKILRKIFGPNVQADGSWRIKTNEEFDKLTKRKNIVREIKSGRLAWLVQLERTGNIG
jgi:hypothetical protein